MLNALRRAVPFLADPAPAVPAVRLDGVIGRGGRLSRGLTLDLVEPALERAFRMGGAPAVALQINSPGGSPVQSRLIHDRIRELAAEHDKKVFAFCEDVAASGGYMLAIAADEIWADASSIVGSIGVVGATFGAVAALEKLGLERRVYTAGKNKVRLDPFLPENPDDVAWVEALQKDLHAEFITLVKARRGGKLDESITLFEGDAWPARRAREFGIIDGVGHMRGVLARRYGDAVRIRKVPLRRPPLLARFLNGGADALLDAAEERAHWARFGL